MIVAGMYAMYTTADSVEGACSSCVPRATGDEAASLGAYEPTSTDAAPVEALHTFMLDSGASRCFCHDCTTITPLTAPVPVTLADPSGGPVVARASTVLPCPTARSGSLSGLYFPSFTTNLEEKKKGGAAEERGGGVAAWSPPHPPNPHPAARAAGQGKRGGEVEGWLCQRYTCVVFGLCSFTVALAQCYRSACCPQPPSARPEASFPPAEDGQSALRRCSSPSSTTIGRFMLSYLFPKLSYLPTIVDLMTHLRSLDTRYCAALKPDILAVNPPPMPRLVPTLSLPLVALPSPPSLRGAPLSFLRPLLPLLLLLTSFVLRRSVQRLLLVGGAVAARVGVVTVGVVGLAVVGVVGRVVVVVVGVAEVVVVVVVVVGVAEVVAEVVAAVELAGVVEAPEVVGVVEGVGVVVRVEAQVQLFVQLRLAVQRVEAKYWGRGGAAAVASTRDNFAAAAS
ncbi:unnamed protein product [Closterium sp. NIES-53]